MKVHCVYRWRSDSELIFSEFDTDTSQIDGLGKKYLDFNAGSYRWFPGNYLKFLNTSDAELERIILSNRSLVCVIEYSSIGVIGIFKNGQYSRYLWANEGWEDFYEMPVPFRSELISCGVVRTKFRQFVKGDIPMYLYYDVVNQCCHTSHGDLSFLPLLEVSEMHNYLTTKYYRGLIKAKDNFCYCCTAAGIRLFKIEGNSLVETTGQ